MAVPIRPNDPSPLAVRRDLKPECLGRVHSDGVVTSDGDVGAWSEEMQGQQEETQQQQQQQQHEAAHAAVQWPNGAVPARGFLTGMAQAVRAPDCPWRDMTRLVREAASCR